MKKTTNTENSLLLIHNTIKEAIDSQQTQRLSLESKANALTGFAGGMFALLIGVRETILVLDKISQTLILASILLFALSVILNNIVTWVRRYRQDPDPEALAKNYLNKSEQETRLQLTSNLIGSWKRNRKILERNSIFLRVSFLFQAIAFIFLGVALFISIF